MAKPNLIVGLTPERRAKIQALIDEHNRLAAITNCEPCGVNMSKDHLGLPKGERLGRFEAQALVIYYGDKQGAQSAAARAHGVKPVTFKNWVKLRIRTPKIAAQQRKNRNKRYESGICAHCNNPRELDKVLCVQCYEAKRLYNRARGQQLKAAGLCIQCGIIPPLHTKTQCVSCHKRQLESIQRRRKTLEAEGVCRLCYAPSVTKEYCRECADRVNENKRKRNALKKAS